jgi:signal transduction histidine kinase
LSELEESERDRFARPPLDAHGMKVGFVDAAAHDLRDPLRLVAGLCDLMSKDYADRLDDRGREYLTLAAAATAHMTALLDDLVDLEGAATAPPAEAWIDANACVDQVLLFLGEAIRKSGAQVTRGELPRVWGNPVRFSRVVRNLVGNALKYVPEGRAPRVRISAARDGKFWRISVSDNGVGVAPRHQDRIFEPFSRLHAADAYDGRGLGLAICRTLVEAAGGRIRVCSTPGEGSVFSFTVKIRDQEEGDGRVDV